MRHKTIREAVVGAILASFILAASPATARIASPAPRPVRAPGSFLIVLEAWFSVWAGVAFERAERPSEVRNRTKTGSSHTPPATSSAEGGNASTDRGAAIDPLGLD